MPGDLVCSLRVLGLRVRAQNPEPVNPKTLIAVGVEALGGGLLVDVLHEGVGGFNGCGILGTGCLQLEGSGWGRRFMVPINQLYLITHLSAP